MFLNALALRIGQDSPEFDRDFAEWLPIKDKPEAVCDQIIVLEARRKLAEWLKTLSPPKAKRSSVSTTRVAADQW